MTRRLSRRGYGTVKPDKKLYTLSHGVEVVEHVPQGRWVQEILKNPNGLTATKAKQDNDPDLNKIEVPVIGINHDHRVSRKAEVSTRGSKYIKPDKPKTLMITTDINRAKKQGWLEASEGKAIKQHKIPMLEEEKDE